MRLKGLYIEDDKKNICVTKKLFEQEGFDLEALDELPVDLENLYPLILERNIDFLLIDHELNKLVSYTGFDALNEIRKHDRTIYAVLLTNFEVEDFHTYFVGENGIFVHNGCGDNSWNDYQKEHAGEGKNRSELAAEYNATKPVKSTNSKGKVHGNSLDYEGTNYGYELKDRTTGETLKYGESIDPQKRYSQAELDRYNADMYIQVQGSKREIHNWQHEKILDYMYVTDQHPLLNKSLW